MSFNNNLTDVKLSFGGVGDILSWLVPQPDTASAGLLLLRQYLGKRTLDFLKINVNNSKTAFDMIFKMLKICKYYTAIFS